SSRLARRVPRKSTGSKPRTSAPTWLLNGEGSNRLMRVTAERCARSPLQRPSTPTPIGVTAPIPVMTTRRESSMVLLHVPLEASQRARGDPVHKHRADDPLRRGSPDQRPGRPIPLVYQLDRRAGVRSPQPPHHSHAPGDAADVPITDLPMGSIDP